VIVLDASAVVELLLGTVRGTRVFERIARSGESLHAPHLMDLEVASALRQLVRIGGLTTPRAAAALSDLGDVALTRYPHGLLLPRIWQLRDNATTFDAAYLSLAEALDAVLVTCDRPLGAVPGHWARVEVIEA
jgi:predicted nucleic acid-binding protein